VCFGGGSAPAPPAIPAPPQMAVSPTAAAVRNNVLAGAGQMSANSTLLTGGMGAPVPGSLLGKKSLLGG